MFINQELLIILKVWIWMWNRLFNGHCIVEIWNKQSSQLNEWLCLSWQIQTSCGKTSLRGSRTSHLHAWHTNWEFQLSSPPELSICVPFFWSLLDLDWEWWWVKWSGLYFGGLCPSFFHCFWGKKNPECLQDLLLTILSAFKEHWSYHWAFRVWAIALILSEPNWTEILFCVQQQAAASSIHKNASSTLLEWIVFAMGLKDILSKELWPNTQQPQKQTPSFWVGFMILCSFCFERQENSMQIIACVWNVAQMCKMLDWFWTLTWTPLALWQWWSLLAKASKLWEPWWGTTLCKV